MSDISKIRIEDSTYEVKDEELRNIINILLGRNKSQTEEENSKE